MSYTVQPATDMTAERVRRRTRLRIPPTLAAALILWIASNVFVTAIAILSRWEGTGSYKRMADLCLWDCNWYASVVQSGYWTHTMADSAAANWPFHPLFPMTAYPLHNWLKLSLHGSMVLASKLELLLAIWAFLLMLSDDMESTADRIRAGTLVAFNPYVIYAHAGYAEPLYFGLIALAFYFARRQRWITTGAVAGLASATRPTGVLFAAAYLVSWLKAGRWRTPRRKIELSAVIGLLLCPLGTALFMLYLHRHVGDALALQHGHVSWGREFGNPLHTLWLSLAQGEWSRVWGVLMIAAWIAAAWLLKLRKAELGIFLALALLIAFLSPMAGYWGVARYIWWQPPFLYAIYRILRRNDAAWIVYLAFASGMAAFMTAEWLSGHRFVV